MILRNLKFFLLIKTNKILIRFNNYDSNNFNNFLSTKGGKA